MDKLIYHSFTDVITNSSSVLFVSSRNTAAVKSFLTELLLALNIKEEVDDLFDIVVEATGRHKSYYIEDKLYNDPKYENMGSVQAEPLIEKEYEAALADESLRDDFWDDNPEEYTVTVVPKKSPDNEIDLRTHFQSIFDIWEHFN